ncbi:MAG: hypothetical protein AAGK37_15930 [Pseudomonadota bacterium]
MPECLRGLTAPNQESCSAAEISEFADAVDAYNAALQDFIADADRYASDSVAFANAAIKRANAARDYADDVFAFAECETSEVRAQTE